jgi:hypothetical protein
MWQSSNLGMTVRDQHFAHKELKIEKFNESFVLLHPESFVLQSAI